MNWETSRSLSRASSRRDREEFHTHTGTPTRCLAFRISRKMSSPVYLDRFKPTRITFGIAASAKSPCLRMKVESFASVRQVNQFKSEILLIQGPLEKEDVGAALVNDKNPGYGNNRSELQVHSQRPTIVGRPSSFCS